MENEIKTVKDIFNVLNKYNLDRRVVDLTEDVNENKRILQFNNGFSLQFHKDDKQFEKFIELIDYVISENKDYRYALKLKEGIDWLINKRS